MRCKYLDSNSSHVSAAAALMQCLTSFYTGYDRKNIRTHSMKEEETRIRKENIQEKTNADFRKFQREGVFNRDQKIGMRCSNSSCNKPDQLQQMVTSTHTCGIRTPTPFLGRAIPIHICIRWRHAVLFSFGRKRILQDGGSLTPLGQQSRLGDKLLRI